VLSGVQSYQRSIEKKSALLRNVSEESNYATECRK